MSEETTNPVSESIEPEVSDDADSLKDDDAESTAAEAEAEEEEVEHEGTKYKIPRALKSALMMQADYTRKTQEVAQERKGIEQDRERFVQQVQAQQADMREYAQLYSVGERLQQYEQVNWQKYSADDPVAAQAAFFEYSQLKEARSTLANNLTQKQEQKAFEKQQETAKQLEQSQATLAREIKGWSPALQQQLVTFARQDGWSDSEINNVTVAQIKTLHARLIGDQVIKKQLEAAPKTEAKPVTQVGGGGASARKSPTQMSDSEFAKWRHATASKNR